MNRVAGALKAAVFTFGNWTRNAVGELALVPYYLGHLLWLIDRKFRDLATSAYGGNAAVYACVRLLITSVPEPPLVPYTRQPDGEPGDPLAWGHPLRQLIRRPNPLLTEYEFWEMTTLFCAITGIAHWYRERNVVGQTIAFWPLRPDRVGPIYARPEDYAAGKSDNPVLLGWSYQVPGTTTYLPLPRADVLTFNFPDPAGESAGLAEGLGPLQVLASEVGADNEATKYVGSLLHNHAIPGSILQTAGKIQTRDDMLIIKQQFMESYGGARRGEPMIVDNGTTVTAMSFSLQQLEFPQLRKVSESRIAAAFGVPAILAGLLVGLDASSTNATVDQLRAYLAETTLANYWRRFSDQYTNDVAPEYGEDIVCMFDMQKVRAFAAQAAIEIDRLATAYQNGALTRNEMREALGYEKRKDGDVYVFGIGAGRGEEEPIPASGEDPNQDPDNPEPTLTAGDDVSYGPAEGAAAPSGKSAPASGVARGRRLAGDALDTVLDQILADIH